LRLKKNLQISILAFKGGGETQETIKNFDFGGFQIARSEEKK
jgi:hypothetical protein